MKLFRVATDRIGESEIILIFFHDLQRFGQVPQYRNIDLWFGEIDQMSRFDFLKLCISVEHSFIDKLMKVSKEVKTK